MTNRLALLLLSCLPLLSTACAYSGHAVKPSTLGAVQPASALEAVIDLPGPVTLETVNSADWLVPLSGLLNLEHPKAVAAGLHDHDEPMQIYFHVLRHPKHGVFLVDTGVPRAFRDDPASSGVGWLVRRELHLEKMTFRTPLADWLAKEPARLAGVFLTHLHIDHIAGMPDVPRGTPLYAGPGETDHTAFVHLALAGSIDGLLEGHAPIAEWQFQPDPDQRFAGVLDVFGDGSVWALYAPGHTPGSTAYLVRTPDGPVLLVGDNCHTRWGWDHGVEPGEFTLDRPRNAVSLEQLQDLVARHPKVQVRLGHQP